MNYIPASETQCRQRRSASRAQALRLCGLALSMSVATAACNAPASESERQAQPPDSTYRLEFRVSPLPELAAVDVELKLKQANHLLREFRMQAPSKFFSRFSADGSLTNDGNVVIWRPGNRGGTLSWRAKVNRERQNGGLDAYMTDDWSLFRASDIIPPAATRTLKGARSETSLVFSLPDRWTSVTQYEGKNHRYAVHNPARRYDRPTGWIMLGRIGTRTDKVSGVRVTIAAPFNQNVRRMDLLAMLRWTIPEAIRIFEDFPARLTVFSADDPMWRGGLSAPESLYIHASRPLISENGTSTLLHEAVHVAMNIRAAEGADWIVEGLAEFYSLQLLLRSGTISPRRYEIAIDKLRDWGKKSATLCGPVSSGPVTAKAAVLMHTLDQEIREDSSGRFNLDDVIDSLADANRPVTMEDLNIALARLLEKDSSVLQRSGFDNC